MKASQAIAELKKYQEPERLKVLSSFFKTGKGQYGEGDKFIGVTVPNTRIVARKFIGLSLSEIEKLLMNKVHECRSLGAYILDARCEALNKKALKSDAVTAERRVAIKAEHGIIFDFYLAHTACINNWDLVDASARDVVGGYLFHHVSKERAHAILAKLAKSHKVPHALWERRIAMIATFYFIMQREFDLPLAIAESLLGDKHDLMHKAVGWMLREVGNRDLTVLRGFLDRHAATMPRTALRYAIERMTPEERAGYMSWKTKQGPK